eukprot:g4987.t1
MSSTTLPYEYEEYILSEDEGKEDRVNIVDPYDNNNNTGGDKDDDDAVVDDEGTTPGKEDTTTTTTTSEEGTKEAAASGFEEGEEVFKDWVMKRVRQDVTELNALKNIRANFTTSKIKGKIYIFIGIHRDRFGMNAERARSYLLDPDEHICLKLTFGRFYCGDVLSHQRTVAEVKPEAPDIHRNIVQSNVKVAKDLEGTMFDKSPPCSLSWFLHQRLNTYICGDIEEETTEGGAKGGRKRKTSGGPKLTPGVWPPHLDARGFEEPIETKFIRSEIRHLMEEYDIEEEIAGMILTFCGEDFERAMNMAVDEYSDFARLVGDDASADGDDDDEDAETGADVVAFVTLSKDEFQTKDVLEAIARKKSKILDFIGKRQKLSEIRKYAAKNHKLANALATDARYGTSIVSRTAILGAVMFHRRKEDSVRKELMRLVNPPERDRTPGSEDDKVIWQFAQHEASSKIEDHIWMNYDSKTAKRIDAAYVNYKKGKGPEAIEISVPSKKKYVLNLKLKKQKSLKSKFERQLRRMDVGSLRTRQWMKMTSDVSRAFQDLATCVEKACEDRKKEIKIFKKHGGGRSAYASSHFESLVRGMTSLGASSSSSKSDDDSAPPPPPPALLKQMSTGGKKVYDYMQIERAKSRANFLIRVVHKIMEFVRNYTTRCLICNAPLAYPGAKPTACHKSLCQYRFRAIGLGVDIRKAIVEQRGLFDLLLFFFWMCVQPGGKSIWPQTYAWDLKDPKMVYPWMLVADSDVRKGRSSGSHPIFYEDDYKAKKPQNRGLANLKTIMDKMPKLRLIAQWAKKERDAKGRYPLYRELSEKDDLLLPLIRWLYTSNMAHVRRLKKSEMLGKVNSQYQFVLMTGSMDKEHRFQELKRETSFARRVMASWNVATVNAEIVKAHNSRKSQVVGLLTDGTSLYAAKARLAVATQAVRSAQLRLAKKDDVDDIDAHVVKVASGIVSNGVELAQCVSQVYDTFKAQRAAMVAAGKPPKIDARTKSTAMNATGIAGAGTNGSFFCWHGSMVGRWHIILRTGLRNLSGTKLQAFGVAYGEGCYFARDLNTSMGYANNHCGVWPGLEIDGTSLAGKNIRCASMCEVINRPEDFTSTSPYFVVPNEDYITTRFIFLFNGNPTSVNAMDVKIPSHLPQLDRIEPDLFRGDAAIFGGGSKS